MHILETSVPELVGYTVRGRYIVNHQRLQGMDPFVVTSPFYRGRIGAEPDLIDGTRYYRSNRIPRPERSQGRLASYWTRIRMLRRYRELVAGLARRERPAVIHAHSSYTNGVAAGHASRATGIPFVYELRTLWGEAAVVEEGLSPRSLKYRSVWRLELGVMRAAHRVVAISRGIRDAVAERGIPPEKIVIVPNGVDTEVFAPRPRDAELAAALALEGRLVVGFIGSLRRLEGLDLLVGALPELLRRRPEVRLLVVGDGPERSRLEQQARSAGVAEAVRFTGLVPHEDVLRYYSIMDVLAYPRIDARINHTVTPLKPLEAMAMGKACLASDVGALCELVEDGVTGLVFARGDREDLAAKLQLLAEDATLRSRLGAQGQSWVRSEREWRVLVPRYASLYEELAPRHGVRRR